MVKEMIVFIEKKKCRSKLAESDTSAFGIINNEADLIPLCTLVSICVNKIERFNSESTLSPSSIPTSYNETHNISVGHLNHKVTVTNLSEGGNLFHSCDG